MRFINVIVCDDVRREDNGKLVLIGIYLEDLLFSKYPGGGILTVWTQFYVHKNGEVPVQFRVLKDNEVLGFAEGILNVTDYKQPITMQVPPFAIQLDSDGLLLFQLKEGKKKWQTMKTLRARLHKK